MEKPVSAETFSTNQPVNEVARTGSRPTDREPKPRESEERASTALERWLLRRALAAVGNFPIAVTLWDGTVIGPQAPVHRIDVANRRTLWKLFLRPDFEFAEGYVAGTITTDSDLTDLAQVVFTALENRSSRPRLERILSWITARSRSLKASRKNIRHHYDLGNDFYRLWLDEQLLYTCAYFETDAMSLEAAQIAKMDHVCRKLRLQPGERVIEAGCGWGAFALHMARHYGVQVTAYNISHEQIVYARQQAQEQGLADRVTFIEDDWRHMSGSCDAFVSVGMLEHVGPENYRRLGGIVRDCLTPDGRGLIHSIGLNEPRLIDRWTEKHIFPGAQPPTLRQAMDLFEPHRLSVLDVENLRLHYAETLRHWLARFEASVDIVRDMFDDAFVRMWRLYLAASVATFEAGGMQLFQILFAPAANNHLPRTRHHLYPQQP